MAGKRLSVVLGYPAGLWALWRAIWMEVRAWSEKASLAGSWHQGRELHCAILSTLCGRGHDPMSTAQRIDRGFHRLGLIIVVAAVALTGCSDTTDADYEGCQVRAYDALKQNIWKSDDALAYVYHCMLAAGYMVKPLCFDTLSAKENSSPMEVALLPTCFERSWWNGWRSP